VPKQLTDHESVVQDIHVLSREQNVQGFLDLLRVNIRKPHIGQRLSEFLIMRIRYGIFSFFGGKSRGQRRITLFTRGIKQDRATIIADVGAPNLMADLLKFKGIVGTPSPNVINRRRKGPLFGSSDRTCFWKAQAIC
jgi:hypothetical protein